MGISKYLQGFTIALIFSKYLLLFLMKYIFLQVDCSGPGIQANGVASGKPTQFKIDTRRAGNAPLDVQVLDGNCSNLDAPLIDNRDGTFTCNYTPKRGSKHIVQVVIVYCPCGVVGIKQFFSSETDGNFKNKRRILSSFFLSL